MPTQTQTPNPISTVSNTILTLEHSVVGFGNFSISVIVMAENTHRIIVRLVSSFTSLHSTGALTT